MANHKSAKKRARQTIRKAARNSQSRKAVRTFEKKLRVALDEKNADLAKTLMVAYESKLGKAAQKGLYHAKTASRKVSRLAKQVAGLN
ncbi:MAG: 30S ribosomal protein S20 [Bdellovibrionales bacterium]|nr:30S ribosomal protein S20 [Bdellovibrionales bacterium]